MKVASLGKAIGNIGIGLGGISLGFDVYQTFVTGDMSYSRFGYHALLYGISFAGPVGLAVSVAMTGAESIYDNVLVPFHDSYRKLSNSMKNPSNWSSFYGY
jgi:hypothetical protein